MQHLVNFNKGLMTSEFQTCIIWDILFYVEIYAIFYKNRYNNVNIIHSKSITCSI